MCGAKEGRTRMQRRWTVWWSLACLAVGGAGCSLTLFGDEPGDGDAGPTDADGGTDVEDGADVVLPDGADVPVSVCGNRTVDDGEECDDGNVTPDDGCENDCSWSCENEADCDDGVFCNGRESCTGHVCLESTTPPTGACTTSDGLPGLCAGGECVLATCGDSRVDEGEECDDGNDDNSDACLDNCRSATCGDGYIHIGGEDCDAAAPRACTTSCGTSGTQSCIDCTWEASCVPPPETCDSRDEDCDGATDEEVWCPIAAGTTEQLNDVWFAADGSSGFAVGNNGIIRRWNGAAWSDSDSDVTDDLLAVWGASANQVWAGGGNLTTGRLLYWNGTSWAPQLGVGGTGAVHDLWGRSATDVWLVQGPVSMMSSRGRIYHRTSSGWTAVDNPVDHALYGICGLGSLELSIVGHEGTVLLLTSRGATSIGPRSVGALRACLDATVGRAVEWVFGDSGQILSYESTTWTSLPALTRENLRSAWNGWVVGDGGTILRGPDWRPVVSGTAQPLRGVHGYEAGSVQHVFAVGAMGTILHWHD